MKGLRNIKISHKLIGGFVASSLAVGIVGGVGVYNMDTLNENSKYLSDNILNEIQSLAGINYALMENKASIHQLLNEKNKSQMNAIIHDVEKTSILANEYIKQYESLGLTGEQKEAFEGFKNRLQDYIDARDKVIGSIQQGDYEKAYQIGETEYGVKRDSLLQGLIKEIG